MKEENGGVKVTAIASAPQPSMMETRNQSWKVKHFALLHCGVLALHSFVHKFAG